LHDFLFFFVFVSIIQLTLGHNHTLVQTEVKRCTFTVQNTGVVQHAVGFVSGGSFYGAKASLNVWPAQVASPKEFSLSQIWGTYFYYGGPGRNVRCPCSSHIYY
jgi:hypothetical protein